MSASNIDTITSLWAASLAQHNDVPPFKNANSMYSIIDSNLLGDVPWQSFTLNYNGDLPNGKVQAPWMDTDTRDIKLFVPWMKSDFLKCKKFNNVSVFARCKKLRTKTDFDLVIVEGSKFGMKSDYNCRKRIWTHC